MGVEVEYKLRVADADELARLMQSPEVEALRITPWAETRMKTTYYDAPDGRFATRKWTLRRRMENDKSVICLKTPLPERNKRGEWEIESDALDLAAVERLLLLGAPREFLVMYGDGALAPVCGAEFLRRSAMLEFEDGSRAEIAADSGVLFGPTERMPLCELELELYRGESAQTEALARRLCQTYGLHFEPNSKVSRARSLR